MLKFEKKIRRQKVNGHEITHSFKVIKKKAPKSLVWHLYYEHTNNNKFYCHCINNIIFILYILTKTCIIYTYVFVKLFIPVRFNDIWCKLREDGDHTETCRNEVMKRIYRL